MPKRWYAVHAGYPSSPWGVADDATTDSEARIVSGLTQEQATKIAAAHNREVGMSLPIETAIDASLPDDEFRLLLP